MNSNKQNLINKIKYRSQYRGTKEMDLLLGKFVKMYIDEFNDRELKQLEQFLKIDDDTLLKFYLDKKSELKLKDNKISQLFKNFKI